MCAVFVTAVNVASAGDERPLSQNFRSSYLNEADTIIVPSGIQTSFVRLYPNASRVVWYRYTPANIVIEPGMWYSTMDTSDYYANFW